MASGYLLNLHRAGRGPVIVLVHGVAGSSRIWEPVVGALVKHFEVVRVDLLGYGRSPKPDVEYTSAMHVDSLHHTLAHHGIRPPFALAGLSMGTLLVLEYARRWPDEVSKLLCIGLPYYPSSKEARAHLRHSISARIVLERPVLGRVMIQGGWRVGKHSQYLAGMFAKPYTPAMAQESMRNTHQAFSSTLMNCLVNNRPDPLLDATATTPQYYLHGELDRYSPVAAVAAAVKLRRNCRFTVLPDVTHNTVILAPEATVAWMVASMRATP